MMRISVILRKAISKSNSSAKRENIDLTFRVLLTLPLPRLAPWMWGFEPLEIPWAGERV